MKKCPRCDLTRGNDVSICSCGYDLTKITSTDGVRSAYSLIDTLKGIAFYMLALSVFILIVADFFGKDTYGLFGTQTNMVSVPARSSAAIRGYTIAGEGTPVYRAPAWPSFARELRYISIMGCIVGICITIPALMMEFLSDFITERNSIISAGIAVLLTAVGMIVVPIMFGVLFGLVGGYILKSIFADVFKALKVIAIIGGIFLAMYIFDRLRYPSSR